jgi:hypothetical protein
MESYSPSSPVVIGICVVVGIFIIGLLIKVIVHYTTKTPEDYQCERAGSPREIQEELFVLYGPRGEAQVQKPAAVYQKKVAYIRRHDVVRW